MSSSKGQKRQKLRRIRIPAFSIFYNSTFTFILLILLAALVITPGDHIYQTISNGKLGNVFVVAGTYVVTGLIALFIYASRLYTNRTALTAIPRSYLPIAKGEVSRKVFRAIGKERERSALVAWEGRPRDLGPEWSRMKQKLHKDNETGGLLNAPSSPDESGSTSSPNEKRQFQSRLFASLHRHQHISDDPNKIPMQTIPSISRNSPPWGSIAHPGWSAPGSTDLPSLHFQTVLAELPNLIEAQAVSMAPPDPAFSFLTTKGQGRAFEGDMPLADQIPPDPDIVAALQRQKDWGLREYIGHLIDVGVLNVDEEDVEDTDETVAQRIEAFLKRYEYARYSLDALTEHEFRDLMARFASLLSIISPMDPIERSFPSPGRGASTPRLRPRLAQRTSGRHINRNHPRRSTDSDQQSIDSTNSVLVHAVKGEESASAFPEGKSAPSRRRVSIDLDDSGSVLHHVPSEDQDYG